LDQLRPAQDQALRLERFLEPEQCDPLWFAGRGLYLVPDGPAAQPAYAVLCQAMHQRRRWALGRMVLGGHRQLVIVQGRETVLVLLVLHYPEQVRACPRTGSRPGTLPGGNAEELRLAEQLIDAASGTVDWTAYQDQAAQELRELIDVKLQGQPAAAAEPQRLVLPLVEALRQSLAATGVSANGKGSRPRRHKPTQPTRNKRTG
jgi:Ku protein